MSRPFLFVRALLTFVLIAAVGLLGTASLGAPAEEHCVANVESVLPSGELMMGTPRCYGSFADAMLDATGGQLSLSTNAGGGVLWTDPVAGAVAASYTLGIHFDGYGGSGSSISVVGSDCTGGWWNTGGPWANRISSSWNGCHRVRHHDLPNRGGTWGDTTGAGATHNVPSWIDNRAESVSYLSS